MTFCRRRRACRNSPAMAGTRPRLSGLRPLFSVALQQHACYRFVWRFPKNQRHSGRKYTMLRHARYAIAIIIALTVSAAAGGAFDGTYKGGRTVLHTINGCAPLDNIRLVINNNHFDRRWGQVLLSVDIANDGTFEQSGMYTQFHSRPRMASIKGKIAGGEFGGRSWRRLVHGPPVVEEILTEGLRRCASAPWG